MRSRNRPDKPAVLKKNAKKWTTEYKAARKVEIAQGIKVKKSIRDRYKHKSIIEALDKMYSGTCCYCEVEISPAGDQHVEHLRPKSRFPSRAFEWDNLHIACVGCNRKKGKKWDPKNPFLDPGNDRIEDHVEFNNYVGFGVRCKPANGSTRAFETIRCTQINDGKRPRIRSTYYSRVLHVILDLKENPDLPEALRQRTELESLKDGECGGMIDFLCRKYL